MSCRFSFQEAARRVVWKLLLDFQNAFEIVFKGHVLKQGAVEGHSPFDSPLSKDRCPSTARRRPAAPRQPPVEGTVRFDSPQSKDLALRNISKNIFKIKHKLSNNAPNNFRKDRNTMRSLSPWRQDCYPADLDGLQFISHFTSEPKMKNIQCLFDSPLLKIHCRFDSTLVAWSRFQRQVSFPRYTTGEQHFCHRTFEIAIT